ncbi:LysR family transcriptional regulator [Aliikangiella coralliicola]|uniref:LysR family transcriptional regulator n=1 Tax=Aliikangiella coralliicola TaxID=2592383 RepID=A0A545UIW6_9GAMM|nr:LysR family transcriptional regulator [Aliikangiella coralliicola]TQV89373.1 LysR family transcriptional regulator [Aliikangiella coralliicola]
MNQFEDMQTFVRIVEAGSITKAADQMDTVKSAVSRRLAELEKRLGVTLLTRTTRSQTLTDSGKSYYQQCLRVIDDVAEIESGIRNEHCALAGRIKIAAPLSFGLAHLSPALSKFNDIHPDIYFDVDFNDRKVDLIEEGFDLALRISKLEDSTLIAKKITKVYGVLCASPAYLERYGKPEHPRDLLDGHVKLNYRNTSDTWNFYDSNKEKIAIKVPSIISANNGDFLCQNAIEGRGLIVTPDFICYKAVKNKQLIPLLCDYIFDNEISAYAVYPQTRHLSQRVRSLVDFLAQYFGEKPYWSITDVAH